MTESTSASTTPPPAANERDLRLLFIGGGNMAAAMIAGLTRAGRSVSLIAVVEPDGGRRLWLEQHAGVRVAADVEPLIAATPAGHGFPFDIVVLAVKPQQLAAACRPIHARLGSAIAVSIAAGARIADIAAWIGSEKVVRAMPNTPALIGRGITALAAAAAVSAAQRDAAAAVMAAVGKVVWVDSEGDLDAVTAISGSGPAYVFYLIEALQAAGVALGLPAATALDLAVTTFTGAAELAANSTDPLDVLRARVTSKGGTTAAALAVFERQHVADIVRVAATAARDRGAALGDEIARS